MTQTIGPAAADVRPITFIDFLEALDTLQPSSGGHQKEETYYGYASYPK